LARKSTTRGGTSGTRKTAASGKRANRTGAGSKGTTPETTDTDASAGGAQDAVTGGDALQGTTEADTGFGPAQKWTPPESDDAPTDGQDDSAGATADADKGTGGTDETDTAQAASDAPATGQPSTADTSGNDAVRRAPGTEDAPEPSAETPAQGAEAGSDAPAAAVEAAEHADDAGAPASDATADEPQAGPLKEPAQDIASDTSAQQPEAGLAGSEVPGSGNAATDAPAMAETEVSGSDDAPSEDHGTDQGAAGALATGTAGAAAMAAAGTAASAPPDSPAAPEKRSGGFLPLVLGGIVAGVIGFGAATYMTAPDDAPDPTAQLSPELDALRSDTESLRAALDSLRGEVEALPPAPDLSPLEGELAELRNEVEALRGLSGIDDELAQLRAAMAEEEGPDLEPLEARIDELMNQRAELVAEQDSALEDIRAALSAREDELDALRAEMDDLRDLAERRVAEAEAAVDGARARAGLDSLRAALSTGAPYPEARAQLQEAGIDLPQALAAPADDGVPTLEDLQDRFPDAARAALRTALQAAPADDPRERLGNFFRAQVGARSTVPRDGDDPDAVLSRAAAKVEAGDLAAALDEITDLSDAARDSLSAWTAGAQARLDAEAALPGLTDALETE